MRKNPSSVRRRLLFTLSAAIAAPLLLPRQAEGAEGFFDRSFGDLSEDLKNALAAGKKGVLLVFEAESCPFCRRMRETVFVRPEVVAFFRRHCTALAVDVFGSEPLIDFAGRETSEKALARAYRIRATPTFVLVGKEGRELARHAGFLDAGAFLAWGRQALLES
ncbi:MAG: thioredoxin family protein [Rhodocyclaceae bacterium]|nr:thioredoxin family protein [Rhodocyclaceae bacterium]